MKILFFLLATANIGLLMWEYKQGAFNDSEVTAAVPLPPGMETIVLASERKPPSQPQIAAAVPAPPAAATVAAPVSTPIQACFQAGPFAYSGLIRQWLREAGMTAGEVKIFAKTEPIITSYRVYFPAAETMEKVQENLETFRNRGFSDAWMITTGAEKGEISLGLFNTQAQATKLQGDLYSKDIDAQIKPLYKPKNRQYVEFKAAPELSSRLALLTPKFPGVEVKPAPACQP